MSTIIRAQSAADFLSFVPHLAGYQPRRSLVLIPFEGSRTAGLLRFDLPADDVEAYASTVIGYLCRLEQADGVVAAIYTDHRLGAANEPVHDDLMSAVMAQVHACGLRLVNAMIVANDGWVAYTDPIRRAHPLREIQQPHDELGTPAQAQGQGTQLPTVGVHRSKRIRDAARQLMPDFNRVCDGMPFRRLGADTRLVPKLALLDDTTALWESALVKRPSQLDDDRAALLLCVLSRPMMRDVALASWSQGAAEGERALAFQLAYKRGEPSPDGPMFLMGEGPRPDAQRLELALGTVRELAGIGRGGFRVGALSAAAWISWALGRGTHADAYAQAALRIDPEHGLSEIVASIAQAGMLPQWAFEPARDTAAAAT